VNTTSVRTVPNIFLQVTLIDTILPVTFDTETKNRAKVFEIYKSPEAFDTHMAGVAFGKFHKWYTENDALAEPLELEKHYLLEDVEKGIVA
jgi:hypothetical protein